MYSEYSTVIITAGLLARLQPLFENAELEMLILPGQRTLSVSEDCSSISISLLESLKIVEKAPNIFT